MNELLKILSDLFPDCVFEEADDFCYHLDEEIVFYPAKFEESHSTDLYGQMFYDDFIARCAEAKNLHLWLLSILHEIGHFYTADEMEDDTFERVLIMDIEDKTKGMKAYLHLHNETIATDWAISYLTANEKNIEKLQKAIDKMLTSIV